MKNVLAGELKRKVSAKNDVIENNKEIRKVVEDELDGPSKNEKEALKPILWIKNHPKKLQQMAKSQSRKILRAMKCQR